MYRPAAFTEDSLVEQHALMRQFPLGLLITAGPAGILADSIPFIIDDKHGESGTLRAHLSRSNPQYKALAEATECLVVFQGPEAYITPTWYPTKKETHKVVPTWNYVAVHAWGRPRLIEDAAAIRAQIDGLTGLMEGHRSAPWAVSEAPESFIESLMQGIFGVEIPIARIEGKWKASQNQPEKNRNGVVEGLEAEGNVPMARVIRERGPQAG